MFLISIKIENSFQTVERDDEEEGIFKIDAVLSKNSVLLITAQSRRVYEIA